MRLLLLLRCVLLLLLLWRRSVARRLCGRGNGRGYGTWNRLGNVCRGAFDANERKIEARQESGNGSDDGAIALAVLMQLK